MKIYFKLNLFFFLYLFLILANTANAQLDTVVVLQMIENARSEFSNDPRTSIRIANQALQLSEKGNYPLLTSKSYNTIGSAYYFLSRYDSAETFHEEALEIQKRINDEEGMGRSYTNLGSIYSDRGLNDKAIEYFLIAEKKFEKIKYTLGQAKLNNSLGILFYNIKDYNNAANYFKAGLNLSQQIKDSTLYYSILINLANTLSDAGNEHEAMSLYKKSYSLAKTTHNIYNLIVACNNICQSYIDLDLSLSHNLDSAQKYDEEAMNLLSNFDQDSQYKILTYTNHASILANKKLFELAIPYLDSAITYARANEDLSKQIALYNELGLLLKRAKKFPEALEALRQSSKLKDTLYFKNLDEKLSELNTIHNVEKKEKEITILNIEKKNQKKINILLLAVIIASVVSLIIVIVSYVRKRKDNKLIHAKKLEVEVKNKIIQHKQKEIIDSINYAKRLQEAILPSDTYWKKYLPESFILYKPKDIVAGDFYWMENITAGTKDQDESFIFFAVADSTGHGIPGALVSVVCSNALNRSLFEFNLTDPAAILDKTRELVIETFDKSDQLVKDGMDISLCRLNSKTKHLLWAGANNPLWLIKNKNLTEIKADKQPVGNHIQNNPFTSHSFQLEKGDLIYLFSDGYADQFGGLNEKKFKIKELAKKIVEIQDEKMSTQKEILDKTFKEWKKNIEQVDDVCILGLRI
jgi:serine phosphatase RsbU (regulator of sigma subunit)